MKPIYQRYMGWFVGNLARLWPYPRTALAERFVDAIGGVDRVVEGAQAAYDAGDFRPIHPWKWASAIS